MTINQFVNNNYDWLLSVATNITATDNNSSELKYDLLAFVTIEIIEAKKYEGLEFEDYKWLFARFLKDNYRWKQGGKFWQQMKLTNQYTTPIHQESENDYIDIMADCDENCDEDLDMIKFYGDFNAEKIKVVRQIESNLPPHFKRLYDLYINEKLSLGQIAIRINIPKASVNNLVNDLKLLIINQWNQSCSPSCRFPVSDILLRKQTSQTRLKI